MWQTTDHVITLKLLCDTAVVLVRYALLTCSSRKSEIQRLGLTDASITLMLWVCEGIVALGIEASIIFVLYVINVVYVQQNVRLGKDYSTDEREWDTLDHGRSKQKKNTEWVPCTFKYPLMCKLKKLEV